MNQNQLSQINAQQLPDEQEISLLDILLFLKGAWKTILITALLGLVIAFIFLLVAPNQFEAVANIAMGRVSPGSANIEEPQALINRMSLPSSFDASAISACGLQDASNLAEQLSKAIKLSIPKGVANVAELKVNRPTPELAQACANSVFEAIVKSQTQMIEPMAQAAKSNNSVRLAKVEARLAQDKTLLARAGEPKNAVSPAYFAILSEIRTFDDEREKLLTSIHASAAQTATLQSPVYVADKPIYPKKALSLLAGLMGGVFLGIVIALTRQILPKLKAQLQGAV